MHEGPLTRVVEDPPTSLPHRPVKPDVLDVAVDGSILVLKERLCSVQGGRAET
jgi:hypothetical protein